MGYFLWIDLANLLIWFTERLQTAMWVIYWLFVCTLKSVKEALRQKSVKCLEKGEDMTYQQGGPQPPVPPENSYSSQGQTAGGMVSYSADPQTQSDSKGYQTGLLSPSIRNQPKKRNQQSRTIRKRSFHFLGKRF